MIGHVAFEVSDLARSARFYDAIFYALGARRMFESDGRDRLRPRPRAVLDRRSRAARRPPATATSRCRRRGAPRSTARMRPGWSTAAATTARPARDPSTARRTTPATSSTPTACGSSSWPARADDRRALARRARSSPPSPPHPRRCTEQVPTRLVVVAYALALLCAIAPLAVLGAGFAGAVLFTRGRRGTGVGVVAVAVLCAALGIVAAAANPGRAQRLRRPRESCAAQRRLRNSSTRSLGCPDDPSTTVVQASRAVREIAPLAVPIRLRMPVERAQPPGEGPCSRSDLHRRPAGEPLGLVVAGCIAAVLVPASAQAAAEDRRDAVARGGDGHRRRLRAGPAPARQRLDGTAGFGYLTPSEITLIPACGTAFVDVSCTDSPGADIRAFSIGDEAQGSGACPTIFDVEHGGGRDRQALVRRPATRCC